MASTGLIGQSIVGGLCFKNGLNRVSHYCSNASSNAATSCKGGPYSPDRLATIFSEYRQAWSLQPKQWAQEIRNNQRNSLAYRPLSLDIELAAICDLACPYCYRQTLVTPDKLMRHELAIQLIDQAADLCIPSIKFNWRGEPLLHPRIYEYIAYAKKKGIADVIINTNATQLSDKNIDSLLSSGIDYVIFSFDGGTKQTYEKNRLGRFTDNSFELVRDNIRKFCRRKLELGLQFPWTRVQMVLTPEAIDEQNSYIELFGDYVDEVCVNNYDERGMGVEMLTGNDREEYLRKTIEHGLSTNSIYMKVDSQEVLVSSKRKTCDQPFQRLLVTYDGRVSMCCFDWGSRHTIGYVAPDSFQDLDYDKTRVKELIDKGAKGFELMADAQLPVQLYSCNKNVKTLAEIWLDHPVKSIRHQQAKLICDAKICATCTYRGSHEWV